MWGGSFGKAGVGGTFGGRFMLGKQHGILSLVLIGMGGCFVSFCFIFCFCCLLTVARS